MRQNLMQWLSIESHILYNLKNYLTLKISHDNLKGLYS